MASSAPADGSYGRWHRYKAATDAVLTWLERAASKAFKKTKKQKKVSMDMRTTGQIWAAAVAVAEAGIAVPLDVWRSLAVSIRLRWQATKSLPHDDGHLHFLTVLRAMQATLTPARPSPPIAATDELSNTFEALALDDDDDAINACMPAFDVAAFAPPAAPTPQETALAQLEADQFRATCFLQDLDELLDEVDAVWTAFEAGDTSLVAATIVTNHVIHVAQSLASALALELPYLDSMGKLDVLVDNNDALQSLVLQHNVDIGTAVGSCESGRYITFRINAYEDFTMEKLTQSASPPMKALLELVVGNTTPRRLVQTRHGSDLCSVHYALAYQNDLEDNVALDRTSMRSMAHAFVVKVEPQVQAVIRTGVLSLLPESAALNPMWLLLQQHSRRRPSRLAADVDMALVVATHCLLKAMMLVDDASLASMVTHALKQQYKSALVRSQMNETCGASLLENLLVWFSAMVRVVNAVGIFPSDAERDLCWLNPYMAGHFLLTSSTIFNGHVAILVLNDVGQGRLVLHVYNALRIQNRIAPVIELDMLLDLLGRDKQAFPTGIPTTPGTFLAAFELANGLALNAVTKASRAPPDRVLETLRANAAHREKQDRRSNLQKALGRSITPNRKVMGSTFSDLSRAYQYATSMQPLPMREGGTLPDLRELWRVADDEWRRFIQLDLMAMSTILTDVANDIAAKATPLLAKMPEVDLECMTQRFFHSGRLLLTNCDLGNLDWALMRNAASIITASSSKLQEAYIVPRSS